MEIIFKGAKIQTGDRIKIPKPVMDTLGLKAGQKIVIKFDAEERQIIIEEEGKKGVKKEKGKQQEKRKNNKKGSKK